MTTEPDGWRVPCDRCGARESEPCIGLARRTDVHLVRLNRAQAAARAQWGPADSETKARIRQIVQAIRDEHGWS